MQSQQTVYLITKYLLLIFFLFIKKIKGTSAFRHLLCYCIFQTQLNNLAAAIHNFVTVLTFIKVECVCEYERGVSPNFINFCY